MATPGIITIRGNLTAQRRRESIRDLADGSASAPSLAFASEQNTGAYWDSGFVVATQGVEAFRIRNTDGQLVADDAWGLANVNAANVSSTNFSWTGANLSLGSDLNVGGNLRVSGQTFTVIGAETVSNALSVTNAGTGPALRIRQNGAQAIMEAYDDANLAFKIHDGGNVSVGTLSTVPSTTFAVLGTSFANAASSNELRVVDGAGTSNVFDVSTVGLVTLHNKLDVMSGVDGGSSRGLAMWQASDLGWGVYVASSGSGKSFAGGSAIAGADFSSHAMRFRAYNATTSGFIWENALESRLMSLNSGTGNLSVVGALSAANVIGNGSGVSSLNLGNVYGTLAVARGGTGVGTSTGAGNVVLNVSPIMQGVVTVSGNVSASYFLGDGSGLTNLPITSGSISGTTGTVATSTIGTGTQYKWTTSGTFTVTGTLKAYVCVVGGGGWGNTNGGGGNGGVVIVALPLPSGTYTVTVGAASTNSSLTGTYLNVTGTGGAGGSGSNASGDNGDFYLLGSPQGWRGGTCTASGAGGGGGGAGGKGGNGSNLVGAAAASGGVGLNFMGTWYGGGGGSGGYNGNGAGGLGGGGNGGSAGTANTGGGGGAGSFAGGSGTVIVFVQP